MDFSEFFEDQIREDEEKSRREQNLLNRDLESAQNLQYSLNREMAGPYVEIMLEYQVQKIPIMDIVGNWEKEVHSQSGGYEDDYRAIHFGYCRPIDYAWHLGSEEITQVLFAGQSRFREFAIQEERVIATESLLICDTVGVGIFSIEVPHDSPSFKYAEAGLNPNITSWADLRAKAQQQWMLQWARIMRESRDSQFVYNIFKRAMYAEYKRLSGK